MTKDMKFGMAFLFVTGMIISGCLGYSIKDNQERDRVELIKQYSAKESSCMRMMYQMGQMTNRVHFNKDNAKRIAIERMQRN